MQNLRVERFLVLLPERNPVVLGDRVAEAGFVLSRLRRRLPEEQ